MKHLKKELEKAIKENNEKEVSRLRSEKASLIEQAEYSIKEHQREIDYKVREYTIEILTQKYMDGIETDDNELFIPDYQRDFKWNKHMQSKLIESLLMGLPIPYIFTADISNEDPEMEGRVEIVDGVQRISTISAFLTNSLELEGLKLLKDLNGFTFGDLPLSRQRRLNRVSVRVIELSERCDEKTRRDLFERINSGSLKLVPQETRHGSNIADTKFYKDVLIPLANEPLLHKLAPVSEFKKNEGEYLELLLRFFAYSEKFNEYKGGLVIDFLNSYLENKKENEQQIDPEAYKEQLKTVLDFIDNSFELGFRKTKNSKSTPRARFEAISVGVALALKESPTLSAHSANTSEWLFSDDFVRATTSDGANNIGNFRRRIEFVKDKLLEGE